MKARVVGTSREGEVIRDLPAIPSVVPGQVVPRTVQVRWHDDWDGHRTWHTVLDVPGDDRLIVTG